MFRANDQREMSAHGRGRPLAGRRPRRGLDKPNVDRQHIHTARGFGSRPVRKSPYVTALDKLLRPAGFVRKVRTWNRGSDSLIDVIDIQRSNDWRMVTVNLGVFDHHVHDVCWPGQPLAFVDEASATARMRLGGLIDGSDRWWEGGDPNGPPEVMRLVEENATRFFRRIHEPGGIIAFLRQEASTTRSYPLPTIQLGVALFLSGDRDEGLGVLDELRVRKAGEWRDRVDGILSRLR